MMNDLYFYVNNIGKIIIKIIGFDFIYYKEINNKLVPLTADENEIVKNILKSKKSTILFSVKLNSIIENNPNLKNFENNLTFYLEWMENFIPWEFRNDFYTNLGTLKINFIDNNSIHNSLGGYYDTESNQIFINKYLMNHIIDKYKNNKNFEIIYNNGVMHEILHELIHMASTHIDKNGEIKSGLTTINDDSYTDGISEGFTEFFSYKCPKMLKLFKKNSGYNIEMSFAAILTEIVGEDVAFESYFHLHDTSLMEKRLNQLCPEYDSKNIFKLINSNLNYRKYCLRNNNTYNQTFVENIQKTLISYYKVKILADIDNNTKTEEEILQSINNVRENLITNETLKKYKTSSLQIEDSLKDFEEFALKVNNMLILKRSL